MRPYRAILRMIASAVSGNDQPFRFGELWSRATQSPVGAKALRRGHLVVPASQVSGKGKDATTRGIVGPAVGDVAPGNVSTTERHAQRSDIMDTPRPLQSIGVRRVLFVRDIRGVVTRRCGVPESSGGECSGCWPASADRLASTSPWVRRRGTSALTGLLLAWMPGMPGGGTARTCRWSGRHV